MTKLVDVVEAKHVQGFRVELVFEDGRRGVVDLSSYPSKGGVFSRLSDPDYFKRVCVNQDLGTICWPDGPDIAPETLYRMLADGPISR
ncbi:MAG: DUF2442 domain-containing protein [Elusimicrobiota bacterium]